MKSRFLLAATSIALLTTLGAAFSVREVYAQSADLRELPARSIPVPDTVSPQLQKLISMPIPPNWRDFPKTDEEWKKRVDAAAAARVRTLPTLRDQLHVKTEPTTIDGVPAFIVTPETIPPENRNRLLIHVHGGCYVFFPGESGTVEAIFMAGFGHFKVISVDYRISSPVSGRPRRRHDGLESGRENGTAGQPCHFRLLGGRRANTLNGTTGQAGKPPSTRQQGVL
jgi:epsilon-lactone hydrolase